MASVKETISEALPEGVKSVLRPPYRLARRIFAGLVLDKPSTLVIRTVDGFVVAYRKDTADEAAINHSFGHDIFFPGVPEYEPTDGHVILDIGAHIGTFSLLASRKVGRGRVFAIEASQDSFNLTRINLALNRCDNASAHHLAVADKDGSVTLHYAIGNWGHSTVAKLSGYSETVEACSLPSFMARNDIARCDFAKLNCEGSEFPVLLNTPKNVLERFGTMLVLYHCDLWTRNTEADLVAHLKASGFECAIRNQTAKRGWIIATRTGPVKTHEYRAADV